MSINFIEAVTATDFRSNQREILESVEGNKVLQVMHRGQPIRLVMTQSYFLNVLAKIEELGGQIGESRALKSKEQRLAKVKEMANGSEKNSHKRTSRTAS
jgi:hypothetical protein